MADNLKLDINWQSSRLKKARFYARWGRLVQGGAILALILLPVIGVLLLAIGQAIGWLAMTIGLWAVVPLIWLKRDLKSLPISHRPNSMADLLSGEVLSNLPAELTPKNLLQGLTTTSGANFFASRYGLSLSQLIEITPRDESQMVDVWQVALDMWLKITDHSGAISSTVVVAAIIWINPAADMLLAELRIDRQDIVNGVAWYEHINGLVKVFSEPKLTGGIARDWSFGYIPTLERFGVNLSSQYSQGERSLAASLPSVRTTVQTIVKTIAANSRHNVVLVGPLGAGKSTVVEALAETLMDARADLPEVVRFNQVFMLDATTIMSGASKKGEIESLINRLLTEAYRAKNIILFLDNAELFLEDGTGAIDLSNLLQPALESGLVKLILAMDEQHYLQIMQTKPALVSLFNKIEIKPTDQTNTMVVLEERVLSIESRAKVIFTYQSLVEAYRLSNRYITDVAQPRAALQLLENAAQQVEETVVTPATIAKTIEIATGIKVDGDLSYGNPTVEKEKLLNLEKLIHRRMINQTVAVHAVASALRRARAGVRNDNHPIGTFLFLGPTGVGKTELAKSLAAVYFGGEDSLIRIDLNEYTTNDDVARLIADGATDPMSLTAQIRKNPFSVVLLDEIEKAHPNVLTTLLQALDEGVLRDINNKKISFKDAIIIATSNAGAQQIRQYISESIPLEKISQRLQNELIELGEFKPEFLNRFDEVAIFRPLTKEELLQMIDLILKGINKKLANQKVSVSVDDEAREALVNAGYDPQLGARPMRRIVQRTVENIVAEKILRGELVPGSGIRLTLADIEDSLSR